MYIYLYIYILLFVTLKKVYDRKVVNIYRIYFLLGAITISLIDYIYIYIYIIQQFSLKYVAFESTVLNFRKTLSKLDLETLYIYTYI